LSDLDTGAHWKLTLVSAPAGFGKTTLVGERLRDLKQRVTWLSGVILPGLSLTRYFYKIKMSGFTTILGILALISGFAQIFGLVAYEWIFLLILLAAYLILRPWLN